MRSRWHCGINRIRLEFKVKRLKMASRRYKSINRIRLEFKVYHLHTTQEPEFLVLIESDWNLKRKSPRKTTLGPPY